MRFFHITTCTLLLFGAVVLAIEEEDERQISAEPYSNVMIKNMNVMMKNLFNYQRITEHHNNDNLYESMKALLGERNSNHLERSMDKHRSLLNENNDDYYYGCADEMERFADCVPSDSCFKCTIEVANSMENSIAVDSINSCSDGETVVCDGFSVCESPCGSCIDEVVDVMECLVQQFPATANCTISCPNLGTSSSLAASDGTKQSVTSSSSLAASNGTKQSVTKWFGVLAAVITTGFLFLTV